jgi:DNA (cytosine-5)-methyltransferase 1
MESRVMSKLSVRELRALAGENVSVPAPRRPMSVATITDVPGIDLTDPRPLVIDGFCCQGGATKGYQDAGFRVLGIDIVDQPNYTGDAFIRADVLEFLRSHVEWIRENVVFGHFSPPCQRYSRTQQIQGNEHPDLIAPTRDAATEIGIPYVIENVENARDELIDPVMLCGDMFPGYGLMTYRHRLFEPGNGLVLPRIADPEHTTPITKMGRKRRPGTYAHFVGNFSGVEEAKSAMRVPWMTRDGIRECIPPVYAEWVGGHVSAHLKAVRS